MTQNTAKATKALQALQDPKVPQLLFECSNILKAPNDLTNSNAPKTPKAQTAQKTLNASIEDKS